MTSSLRKLVYRDETYLWEVRHRHAREARPGREGAGCSEAVSVYLEGFRRSPLRFLFPDGPDHGHGYIQQAGVVGDWQGPGWALNLNRPAVARMLIEEGLAAGWSPRTEPRAFVIEDGFAFFRDLGRPPLVPPEAT